MQQAAAAHCFCRDALPPGAAKAHAAAAAAGGAASTSHSTGERCPTFMRLSLRVVVQTGRQYADTAVVVSATHP